MVRGKVIADRYEIIEELGRGGMGRVFRVEDTKVGQEIALKLINPEVASDPKTIERFHSELRIARMISHRNVCRMFDMGEVDGTHYITMEFIRGEDLKRMIRMSGHLSPGTAVKTAMQIAQGLAEAHRLGIIHRDLKPSNIMIDRQGQARILDFGIARSLRNKGLTGVGMMVGTPEYMSPEQAEAVEIDYRSDIYSLGVIMYEMLTGRVPFEGHTPISIAMQHKTDKPVDPVRFNAQIPTSLSRLILRCLSKDPAKRYDSADELFTALEDIAIELPSTESGVRRKKTTSKEITLTIGPRRLWIWLALLIVSVAAVFYWAFKPKKVDVPVFSDRPSVAVMYFKNNTGDSGFDHWRTALTDLLITDLSQSKLMRVLSAERLFHILEQLDGLDATTFSSQLLSELARRGNVGKILVGSYSKAGDEFRISISLQDAETGELIASSSVSGAGENSLYTMVDRLTKIIKEEFQLKPIEIASDIDRDIESITSRSPEALKYYAEGRRLHLRGDYEDSIESMQKAIEIDPQFAMAYRSLYSTYTNLGRVEDLRDSIQQAYELSDNVSERERYLILAGFYSLSEKTLDKTEESYRMLLSLYPDDSVGISNMGLTYIKMEEWDKAEEQYLKNIRGGYEGWISHWNLAEIYEAKGMYGRAREIIGEKVLEFPEDIRFPMKLADIYGMEGRYDLARDELEKVRSLVGKESPDILKRQGDYALVEGDLKKAEDFYSRIEDVPILRRLAFFSLYLTQGKYRNAIALMQEEPAQPNQLIGLFLRTGRYDEGLVLLDEFETGIDFSDQPSLEIMAAHTRGLALAWKGDLAAANRQVDRIRNLIPLTNNKFTDRYLFHLNGIIAMENKGFEQAEELLNKAWARLSSPSHNAPLLHALFLFTLGEAQIEAGSLNKAADTFSRIINLGAARLWDGDFYAKSYFQLGIIAEKQGNRRKAEEYFGQFLEIWKGADSDLEEVVEATKRISAEH
jgi:eukaryotic-like serine/threonine-protein kinase